MSKKNTQAQTASAETANVKKVYDFCAKKKVILGILTVSYTHLTLPTT